MNVHHASLFPDLIGAADYSNVLIEEWEQNRRDKDSNTLKSDPIIVTPQGIDIELNVPSPIIKQEAIDSIYDLLEKSLDDNSDFEPNVLNRMANEVSKIVNSFKGVDFEARQDLIPALQAKARIVLRKLGYPEVSRDIVINRILEFVPKEES